MHCPECNKPIRCTDTRKKLSYVNSIKKGEIEPVRERKYICGKCNIVYITREYIYQEHNGKNIRDKRAVTKRRSKKIGRASCRERV